MANFKRAIRTVSRGGCSHGRSFATTKGRVFTRNDLFGTALNAAVNRALPWLVRLEQFHPDEQFALQNLFIESAIKCSEQMMN